MKKPYERVNHPETYKKYCTEKLKKVRPHLNKTDSILDAGCGGEEHPYCFEELNKEYPRLTGVDLNGDWHEDIIEEDISSLHFEDEKFDVTICMDVLEHIENWKEALDELIRVTKDKILVIAPTTESTTVSLLWDLTRKLIGVENRIMFGHYRVYLPEEITNYGHKRIESVKMEKIKFPYRILRNWLKKRKLFYAGVYVINLE